MSTETAADLFVQQFGGPPAVTARAPGRINLIGEHTDYNDGFVLPAAINKSVFVCVGPRPDRQVHLYATDLGESLTLSLDEVAPQSASWANYVLGVVDQLQQNGLPVHGFNLTFGGDLPQGFGLSSSAAVECGVLGALNALFGCGLAPWDVVRMAQRAEHTFAGVRCGIMDMFASVFGRREQAMRLDCLSLDFAYVPLDLQDCKILLLNTNVKHSLASTAYNTRRQECEQGLRWVQAHHPEVLSLRDVTPDLLEQYVAPRDPVVHRRCRFVWAENARVLDACADLHAGRLEAFGEKMYGSHAGLSAEYEVSCPELDFLVDFVRDRPGVLGARMMGGGFGGCTINLVRAAAIEPLVEAASAAYRSATGLSLTAFVVETADGLSVNRV